MAVKNPLNIFREKNLLEAVPEVASAVIKKPAVDELSQDWKIAVTQMLGYKEKPTENNAHMEGELHEGEEVSFAKPEEKAKPVAIEAAMNYGNEILHAETTIRREEQGELGARIQQIRAQIAQEAASSDSQQIRSITVESQIQDVGVYDETYHEGLLSRIRAKARSASELVHQKVAKRDFHSLAKKHGTSFSLSAERVVAQQVG